MENENQKIAEKLQKIAEKIKFGTATVEFTFSRGKVAKAIIKETQEVVLFN